MPFGKNYYIRSLERRVAELESCLAANGIAEPGSDHFFAIASPKPSKDPEHPRSEQSTLKDTDSSSAEGDDGPNWQGEVNSVSSVLRDLSLDANGGYIGASSHVTMGRIFDSLAKGRRCHSRQGAASDGIVNGNLTSLAFGQSSYVETGSIEVAEIPSDIATRLVLGYKKHISTRWPVLYLKWVFNIHSRRHSLSDIYEKTMLHLVYATAGRFIETTGESGSFFPTRHYAAALTHMDEILNYNDLRSVCALMLMAVYCLRSPVGPGAWTYNRLAMLMAIDLGLHRQTNTTRRRSLAGEMQKRIFWACYAFDRQISIPMGRPFALSDRDIDVPLPLDVDEATTDSELRKLPTSTSSLEQHSAPLNSTTMSSFVHVVRLRQIESAIQRKVYRVDRAKNVLESEIDGFIEQLERWKTMIPLDTKHFIDKETEPYDGYDYYMVFYNKCLRLLLYPQISKTPVVPRFLKACANACAGMCGTYKRLHQSMAVGYSMMALQSVFMAGLTLVYCIWISPDEIFDALTNTGINDCSIVLFVMAERVRMAKKYRNAFEVIRQRVIDNISNGNKANRREAVGGLAAQLQSAVTSFEINQPFEVDDDSFEQFSFILADMTGETLQSESRFSITNHYPAASFREWNLDGQYDPSQSASDRLIPLQHQTSPSMPSLTGFDNGFDSAFNLAFGEDASSQFNLQDGFQPEFSNTSFY